VVCCLLGDGLASEVLASQGSRDSKHRQAACRDTVDAAMSAFPCMCGKCIKFCVKLCSTRGKLYS
jgi:hypothetical protein